MTNVTGVIKIYYRTNPSVAYTLLTTLTDVYAGDLQRINVPVIGSAIARAHHYQLKIEVTTNLAFQPMLFGLERRYRVVKRSR